MPRRGKHAAKVQQHQQQPQQDTHEDHPITPAPTPGPSSSRQKTSRPPKTGQLPSAKPPSLKPSPSSSKAKPQRSPDPYVLRLEQLKLSHEMERISRDVREDKARRDKVIQNRREQEETQQQGESTSTQESSSESNSDSERDSDLEHQLGVALLKGAVELLYPEGLTDSSGQEDNESSESDTLGGVEAGDQSEDESDNYESSEEPSSEDMDSESDDYSDFSDDSVS